MQRAMRLSSRTSLSNTWSSRAGISRLRLSTRLSMMQIGMRLSCLLEAWGNRKLSSYRLGSQSWTYGLRLWWISWKTKRIQHNCWVQCTAYRLCFLGMYNTVSLANSLHFWGIGSSSCSCSREPSFWARNNLSLQLERKRKTCSRILPNWNKAKLI